MMSRIKGNAIPEAGLFHAYITLKRGHELDKIYRSRR